MWLAVSSVKGKCSMKDIEHARLMLEMARKDFKALGGMTESTVFDDEIFGFHVQQSVEKSLKAWLSLLGVFYPKTHDLRLLFNLLQEQGVYIDSFFNLVE